MEELLVDWPNELLYLSSVKRLIFERFDIINFSGEEITAEIAGGPLEDYRLSAEIKAATYYNLKIERIPVGRGGLREFSFWSAEVIFDV